MGAVSVVIIVQRAIVDHGRYVRVVMLEREKRDSPYSSRVKLCHYPKRCTQIEEKGMLSTATHHVLSVIVAVCV